MTWRECVLLKYKQKPFLHVKVATVTECISTMTLTITESVIEVVLLSTGSSLCVLYIIYNYCREIGQDGQSNGSWCIMGWPHPIHAFWRQLLFSEPWSGLKMNTLYQAEGFSMCDKYSTLYTFTSVPVQIQQPRLCDLSSTRLNAPGISFHDQTPWGSFSLSGYFFAYRSK